MFAKHVKTLCDTDYRQALDLKWARALACWLTILESSGFESNAGAYVLGKLSDQDREGFLTSVRDACGVRSPSTVLKRARDLQQFINWCINVHRPWWPLAEKNFLDFLSQCEAGSRSKFIGKNLVHASKFFKYVMGADIELPNVMGPLLQGRVMRVLATREPEHSPWKRRESFLCTPSWTDTLLVACCPRCFPEQGGQTFLRCRVLASTSWRRTTAPLAL